MIKLVKILLISVLVMVSFIMGRLSNDEKKDEYLGGLILAVLKYDLAEQQNTEKLKYYLGSEVFFYHSHVLNDPSRYSNHKRYEKTIKRSKAILYEWKDIDLDNLKEVSP